MRNLLCGKAGARRARAGLTLVELMVSTAILAGVMLIASGLLVQARMAIRSAEDGIQANANARAVADCLRRDISSGLTKDGYLVIAVTRASSGVYVPHLILTSVGGRLSVTSTMNDPLGSGRPVAVPGNAAQIHYTLGCNRDAPPKFKYLCRRTMIFNPLDGWRASSNSAIIPGDVEKLCLTYFHTNALVLPAKMGDRLLYPGSGTYMLAPWDQHPESYTDNSLFVPELTESRHNITYHNFPQLNLPPNCTLDDIQKNLWPFMLSKVSDVRFMWTPGTLSTTGTAAGTLNWYGIISDPCATNDTGNSLFDPGNGVRALDPNWTTNKIGTQLNWLGANAIQPIGVGVSTYSPEFNLVRRSDGANDGYAAMWNFYRKIGWPKAVKVCFKVGDRPKDIDRDTPRDTRRKYEVVVDLP